jgi:hypothetical protein
MRTYRIAENSEDYDLCRDEMEAEILAFPTIIAEENNMVIGFISSFGKKSNYSIGAVKANSAFVLLRMFHLYETILKNIGVPYYLIHIDRNNKTAIKMLNSFGITNKYDKTDKYLWYIKEI